MDVVLQRALLDANAIWSGAVRDTLLCAAEDRLYLPYWTRRILDEMAYSLKRGRPDLQPTAIERTVRFMMEAFPSALVENYEELTPAMLNHVGDRHVLAAAVHARTQVIVTWNTVHFPAELSLPHGIIIQTPDEFLLNLHTLYPKGMVNVLQRQAATLRRPAQTLRQTLETLRRTVPRFADAVLLSGMIE
ncbi:MAG: PIN domain-containing protein [Chloroflexi bacterium]|nr:PIN domain-containing protein [Chloroflexota bacterium]